MKGKRGKGERGNGAAKKKRETDLRIANGRHEFFVTLLVP